MAKTMDKIIRLTYRGENINISAKVRQNDGDLIIFLHGMGCTKESFNNAFQIQALQEYSICAFDFPGHGMSSRLPTPLYSLQSYADITNQLIQYFPSGRTHLVGHSMGGAVAVIASQAKKNSGCLVCADGNLVSEDCSIASRRIADQSSVKFVNDGFSKFLEKLQNSTRRDYSAWFDWCRKADPRALHQTARSIVEWSDSGKLLELFNLLRRKAYLYGGQDNREYILPRISTTAVSAIPASGHFMMVDNPNGFYRALAEILATDKTCPTQHVESS